MMDQPLNLSEDAPWKLRYRAASIAHFELAMRSPQRGLVASSRGGSMQYYAWDVPSGTLRQITDTPGGHAKWVSLSPDGRFFYYLQDDHGNEIGHFVRLPYETALGATTPVDLTPLLPPYSTFLLTCSDNGARIAFIAAYEGRFHVYCIDTTNESVTPDPRLIYASNNIITSAVLSADGSTIVVASSERSRQLEFDLIAFDTTTGAQIASLSDGAGASLEIGPAAHLDGDNRFMCTSTGTGTERPFIWNPRDGTRIDLDAVGASNAIGSALVLDWSPDCQSILLRTIHRAEFTLYRLDLTSHHLTRLDYGSGTVMSACYNPADGAVFAQWMSPANPSRVVELNESGITRTVLAAGAVPEGHDYRSVSFTSSDGELIQAWLGVPDGPGPFPTILDTHGGPTAVQMAYWAPMAQAWIDHGFAYLSVNYRGSTTFGRDFERKIWGALGQWELEDMVAARDWLVREGIAKPDAILLTGWSYGGYLTLLGLGRRPDLWAGGMAGIAIADWTTMYEDEAEALQGYQRALFGGGPDEKPEQYRVSSPITYAADVRAPILVIQGRNDTRTPAHQMEVYEQRLKSLAKDITVHWFDAGHTGAFSDVEAGIGNATLMLEFAWRVVRTKA